MNGRGVHCARMSCHFSVAFVTRAILLSQPSCPQLSGHPLYKPPTGQLLLASSKQCSCLEKRPKSFPIFCLNTCCPGKCTLTSANPTVVFVFLRERLKPTLSSGPGAADWPVFHEGLPRTNWITILGSYNSPVSGPGIHQVWCIKLLPGLFSTYWSFLTAPVCHNHGTHKEEQGKVVVSGLVMALIMPEVCQPWGIPFFAIACLGFLSPLEVLLGWVWLCAHFYSFGSTVSFIAPLSPASSLLSCALEL